MKLTALRCLASQAGECWYYHRALTGSIDCSAQRVSKQANLAPEEPFRGAPAFKIATLVKREKHFSFPDMATLKHS